VPDLPDDFAPPPKVLRKRLNGVYREDLGFSGPTRRYVLTVALLVGLASVPTLAVLTTGSSEITGDDRSGAMEVPFLPPPATGPVRPPIIDPVPAPSRSLPASPGTSQPRPGAYGQSTHRPTPVTSVEPTRPKHPGKPAGSTPRPPRPHPDAAPPRPAVVPPRPDVAPPRPDVAPPRAGVAPRPVAPWQPGMPGPVSPRIPVVPGLPVVPEEDRIPDPVLPDDFPTVPGLPEVPDEPSVPANRDVSREPSVPANPEAARAPKVRVGPTASRGPKARVRREAELPNVPDFDRHKSDGDGSGLRDRGNRVPDQRNSGSGELNGRNDRAHSNKSDEPPAPPRRRKAACENAPAPPERPGRRPTDRTNTSSRPAGDPPRRDTESSRSAVHESRSTDRPRHSRRSAVADRPYNIRSSRILEQSYGGDLNVVRRLLTDSNSEENRLANRPYRGQHRAEHTNYPDERAASYDRSSRVGRHHAESNPDFPHINRR
jgi:hypothetical protein